MNAHDLMAKITERMIADIEAGAGQWTMPWNAAAGLPHNAVTKKAYRGGNVLALWFAQQDQGYPTAEWATYNAWRDVEAQVRKGQHGQQIVFWDFTRQKVDPATGELKRAPFARMYTVFNAAQVDGYEQPVIPEVVTDEVLDAWFEKIPARIGTGSPKYKPVADEIEMPEPGQFHSVPDYYATLAHELAHWTGHESRLNRQFGAKFGSDGYAAEELVAELSAAFTCGLLDITPAKRSDHASYIGSWIRVLRADPSILWSVASKAQAATDHLVGYHADTKTETDAA